jgi:hypothetical protein
MSVKEWSIVAMQDDAIYQARDVIRFLDHSDNAVANIGSPTSIADDSVVTNLRNEGIISKRRKRRPRVALEFSRLRWQDALRLRQLESEDRPVYFCPNFEESTIWMQPFFGNFTEFLRSETPYSISSPDTVGWTWDETRQAFYPMDSWVRSRAGASPFRLDSPYGIASRPSTHDFTNAATKPQPDSGTTGWSISSGAGTVAYDGNIRMPVVSDADGSETSGGITVISTDGSTGPSFAADHSASGLTADADICCSVLVRAVDTSWVIQLLDHSGATVDSTAFSSDKNWHLVKLFGAQSAGGTTAKVRCFSASGDNREITIQCGTVFIGEMPESMSQTNLWPIPDFMTGDQDGQLYSKNEGPTISGGFTVSILVQHQEGEYPIFILGTGSDAITVWRQDGDTELTLSGVTGGAPTRTFAQAGVDVGDYYMVTVVGDVDGVSVYMNGVLANGGGGGSGIEVQQMTDLKRVGVAASNASWLEMGGVNLFRIDNEPWTAARVLRHYNTYGAPGGIIYVAPTIGWTMYIESLDFEPYNMTDGKLMVQGSIMLAGLNAIPEFRAQHPNLKDNNG